MSIHAAYSKHVLLAIRGVANHAGFGKLNLKKHPRRAHHLTQSSNPLTVQLTSLCTCRSKQILQVRRTFLEEKSRRCRQAGLPLSITSYDDPPILLNISLPSAALSFI